MDIVTWLGLVYDYNDILLYCYNIILLYCSLGEQSYASGGYLKYNAEYSFVVTGTGDAESANFSGGGHMLSDAWANVVISYADQAKRLAGVLWKSVQFYPFRNLVASDKFIGDR